MPLYHPPGVPQIGTMAMMPANADVELLLGWRFHRQGLTIGARFESTAYLGYAYATDAERNARGGRGRIQPWPRAMRPVRSTSGSAASTAGT